MATSARRKRVDLSTLSLEEIVDHSLSGEIVVPGAPRGWISTGCDMLDWSLGGGLPMGRLTELYGMESAGKSLIAISAAKQVLRCFLVPRGVAVIAGGTAEPGARQFELAADLGSPTYGICSNPFLEHGFQTIEYRIKVSLHADGTWSYDEDTVMLVRGRPEPFHHRDTSLLTKIAEPTPNPLARIAAAAM